MSRSFGFAVLARAARRLLLLGPAVVLACSRGGPGPGGPSPQPASAEETLSELFNLTALFQRLGRIAAGPPLPFVGHYAFLAGRGDSTVVLLGLSLDNRALAFQRSGRDFTARYRVEMSLQREGGVPIRYAREEAVTVASFQETQRVDETVIFQQAFLLAPGPYTTSVTLRDPASGSFSQGSLPIAVPVFPPGSYTAPILVYQATPRSSLWADPTVVLNPRGMVAHGDDSLAIYVEAYHLPGPNEVPLEVRDEIGRVVHTSALRFEGGRAVETAAAQLPAEAPSLGRLTVTVGTAAEAKQTTALVSFSKSWVLTNYDNLIGLLRYFGYDDQLDRLRKASPEERPALWRKFWEDTDPRPETPENEALDIYFTRLSIANDRFRDEGGASGGWRTDRGEVYITLGEPDQVYESPPGNDLRLVQWIYNEYRARLVFQGQIGFSRMRLVPESRAEFARVRAMARQHQRSNTG